MLSYANELISMTQGRGSYSMEFSHYDFVPAELAEKVIVAHKPHHEEEGEAVRRKAICTVGRARFEACTTNGHPHLHRMKPRRGRDEVVSNRFRPQSTKPR